MIYNTDVVVSLEYAVMLIQDFFLFLFFLNDVSSMGLLSFIIMEKST